jgi:lysyl-tRNA synthetase class 2
MAIREHGRTSFLDLVDEGRRLQCQVRVDIVGGDAYDFFRRFVERGDFVGVRGVMFNTRMGELTL